MEHQQQHKQKATKDSVVLELKSEIVVSLSTFTYSGEERDDGDSFTWSNRELPRYNDKDDNESTCMQQLLTSDPSNSSQHPVPDSVQDLIETLQSQIPQPQGRRPKQSKSSSLSKRGGGAYDHSLLVVRGVILIGLHLLYGDLALRCRWILRAQQAFGGNLSSSSSSMVDDGRQEHLSQWQSLKETKMTWKVIQTICSLANWTVLLACIAQHVAICSLEHPLHSYAQRVVPNLSTDEKNMVLETLQLPSSSSNTCTRTSSFLSLVRAIQEKFPSRIVYAILLEPEEAKRLPHSCIPTVSLQANYSNGTLQVVSLSSSSQPHNDDDNNKGNDWCLCRIEDCSVEEREEQILLLTGHSCGCLRCRYELKNEDQSAAAIKWESQNDLMTLGHFYLGYKPDELDRAEQVFRAARMQNVCNMDAWHALGAIELARDRFLAAQRFWNESRRHKQECGNTDQSNHPHEGLTLQWTKLDAYDYLSSSVSSSSPSISLTAKDLEPNEETFQNVVPHVFRANLLSKDVCNQIIQWANDHGSWTEQRHYAVPTMDVPVHAVPLLLEWLRPWFATVMRPLLAKQFGTTTHNFYVHDAFVVKYEATLPSNHLPLHMDESTHSFVLALNQEFVGGGTNLVDHDLVVQLQTGDVLSFRGNLVQHGGEPVTDGTRYILAAFLYYDEDNDEEVGECRLDQRLRGGKNKIDHINDDDDDIRRRKRPVHEITTTTKDDGVNHTGGFSFEFKITEE